QQLEHDVPGPRPAGHVDDIVQRLKPFPGLVRVDVGKLARDAIGDDTEPFRRHALSSLTLAGRMPPGRAARTCSQAGSPEGLLPWRSGCLPCDPPACGHRTAPIVVPEGSLRHLYRPVAALRWSPGRGIPRNGSRAPARPSRACQVCPRLRGTAGPDLPDW